MLNISISHKKAGNSQKQNNSRSFLCRRDTIRSRSKSTSSGSSEESNSHDSRLYNRLSRIFGIHHETSMSETYSSTRTSVSDDSARTSGRKRLVHREDSVPAHMIPPYSPTGAWNGKFPYSNFYVRLPNGKWMIRYRSGDRDILGTDEFEGYMI
jgi:hypothetical protein